MPVKGLIVRQCVRHSTLSFRDFHWIYSTTCNQNNFWVDENFSWKIGRNHRFSGFMYYFIQNKISNISISNTLSFVKYFLLWLRHHHSYSALSLWRHKTRQYVMESPNPAFSIKTRGRKYSIQCVYTLNYTYSLIKHINISANSLPMPQLLVQQSIIYIQQETPDFNKSKNWRNQDEVTSEALQMPLTKSANLSN